MCRIASRSCLDSHKFRLYLHASDCFAAPCVDHEEPPFEAAEDGPSRLSTHMKINWMMYE